MTITAHNRNKFKLAIKEGEKMFESVGRSWNLMKMSANVLRKDKEIMLLPLIAGAAMLAIWVSYVVSFFAVIFFYEMNSTLAVLYVIGAFGFYLLSYYIMIYFNAAVIGCATIRLNGGDPVVKDGLGIARENRIAIFKWALVAATIGLILRLISSAGRRRGGLVGLALGTGSAFLGIAWSVAVYFVVPAMIYEKIGPWDAIKRSVSLQRAAWKEAIIGNAGITIIFVLAAMLAFPIIVLSIIAGGTIGFIIGIMAAATYIVLLACAYASITGILAAAMYRFAVTGQISEGFDPGIISAQPMTQQAPPMY